MINSKFLKENFPDLKGKYFGQCLKYYQDKTMISLNDIEKWIDENVPKHIPLQPSIMEDGGPKMNMFLNSGNYSPPYEVNRNWVKVLETLGNISVTPTVQSILKDNLNLTWKKFGETC